MCAALLSDLRCHNAVQVLHPDLLNKNFTQAEYAVRGELYLKGEELRKQGREVIFTNGDAPAHLPCRVFIFVALVEGALPSMNVRAARSWQPPRPWPEAPNVQSPGAEPQSICHSTI